MSGVLFSESDLKCVVADLAAAIAKDFAGQKILLLGLLKGCQPFLADLCRQLSCYQLSVAVDYLQVNSYIGTASSGKVTIQSLSADDSFCLQRNVIVVDDIFDTGLTLKEVMSWLREKGASSVKSCVLLRKSGCSREELSPDYCGMAIPDAFVVGYGLDYNEQYRELPYIKILSQDEQ
ncbi:hypoxanthine phosphoribosyltransferase [bacterium]|nr:hypoxanthine phosphoribosyltransferase [bacterium]